jgi:DNA uptake protein ComE-like DNA-binding protein
VKSSKLQVPSSREAPNFKHQAGDARFHIGAWSFQNRPRTERGSTFIIVLWVAFGLVSMALYFAHSMSFELRAADNRVSGLHAEQAIDGATRYVSYLLSTQISYGSNGFLPDPASYLSQGVKVGDCHFWLIGRDTNNTIGPAQLTFGLVDEGSKINLNSAPSNMLAALLVSLPRANPELAAAILDWRDTNMTGVYQTYYSTRPQPYQCKSAPFETVEELRMIFGADMQTLVGEDLNRNGILDPNESADNHGGILEPGILEYVTVYSREPNTYSNGTARVSLRDVGETGPFATLLQDTLGASKSQEILVNLGLLNNNRGRQQAAQRITFSSPLDLYRRSRMTADEFSKIANSITSVTNAFIEGRVNVNTAGAAVLASLPGLDSNPQLADTLINYRQSNPDKLGSVAWIVDALGSNDASVLDTLRATDCITTQSFQISADIAALGPNGRGYHRIRFVFDTSDGTPRIIYRQDLTHLGWALGKEIRQTALVAKTTR